MKSTRIALAAAGAFLLAACSSGGESSSDDATSATPEPKLVAELSGVVNTSASGCEKDLPKDPGNCWLPLFSGFSTTTKTVNLGGECTTKSQRTCWPQPGERLAVVCAEPNGMSVSVNGDSSTVWLGVAIPRDRVLVPLYDPELDKKGRAVVFVSTKWVDVQSRDKIQTCSDFFASTNEF